ncbi:hypothetical protein ABW19_dt0204238 [Dactylella cylindrospora]|nr:hypothetical protein ABW19_dt0204238 [Dactylella cylindrospora]
MLPSAFPNPSKLCNSSINRIISPFESSTSFITFFNLSSNSPRNFAPPTSNPRSSAITLLFNIDDGTSPCTILCAKPSIIAVLPTPAEPTITGLFFDRRDKT